MDETYLLIEDKKYSVKYPNLLNKFLDENAEKIETKTKEISKLAESLLPLIPIAIGIGAGAIATWAISKEQKEKIMNEYIE